MVCIRYIRVVGWKLRGPKIRAYSGKIIEKKAKRDEERKLPFPCL